MSLNNEKIQNLVRELLSEIGEDPKREGLVDTPKRIASALEFLTSGYRADIGKLINEACFAQETTSMVIVRDIAHVQEVGGLTAGQLDDVHGGHRQPGPVHHAPDVPIQLDVVEAVPGGLDVERGLLVDVAQGHDLLVAVERVVVEVELRIQGQDSPIGPGPQRPKLARSEHFRELQPEARQLVLWRIFQLRPERANPAGLIHDLVLQLLAECKAPVHPPAGMDRKRGILSDRAHDPAGHR